MNAKLLTLTALSVFALAACGGGGSDSPVQTTQSTKQDNNVKPQQSQQQSQKPQQQQQQQQVKLDVEYEIYRNGKEINNDDAAEDKYPQNRLNVMNLDGRNLVIIPDGVQSKGILRLEDSTMKRWVGGADLSYARYGVISYLKENKDYIFVQGVESQETKKWDMPNTNGVIYKGNAVAYHISDGALDKGTVTFTANFKNKNMSGSINLKQFGTLSFDNIKIDGNDFEGGSGARKIEGDFYGAKAAEMAGEFEAKDKGIIGVFGAKKQ